MKKTKRFISAVLAAVMAFVINTSVMAETVTEPATVDINGYSCYERDGEYWTVLDGVEYLVVNLDDFTEVAAEDYPEMASLYGVSDECPIGRPPYGQWIYNGYVELSESNNYTYRDRCYLTLADYYSPVYYFKPKNPNNIFVAKIDASVFNEKYYVNIWKHSTITNSWLEAVDNQLIQFNFLLTSHILLTGTETQSVDGLALKFLTSSTGKELYYNTSIEW